MKLWFPPLLALALGLALAIAGLLVGSFSEARWIVGAATILVFGAAFWARPGDWISAGSLLLVVPLAFFAVGWGVFDARFHTLLGPGAQAIGSVAVLLGAARIEQILALRRFRLWPPDPKRKLTLAKEGAKPVTVALAGLVKGDRVLLATDEEVPADGVVIRGVGFVDESAVGGASLPIPKQPGDTVLAGSVMALPEMVVELSGTPEGSLLAQRERHYRTMAEDQLQRGKVSHLAAALMIGLGLAAAASLVIFKGATDRNQWVPSVLLILLAAGGAAPSLALRISKIEALWKAKQGGWLATAEQIFALAAARRWAVDPRLLAGGGNVEVFVAGPHSRDAMLQVAAALLSESEAPERPIIEAALAKVKLKPLRGAALKRQGNSFLGTVEGHRWLMAPRAELAQRDKSAADPSFDSALKFLEDKGFEPQLLVRDGELMGAVAVQLTPDPDVRAAAVALDAGLEPGAPIGLQKSVALPESKQPDARLLSEDTAADGIVLRVIAARASLRISEPAPRILKSGLSALAQVQKDVLAQLQAGRKRLLLTFVPLLLASAVAALGAPWPVLGMVAGLVALALARPRAR